jgi:hypothetical protein
MHGKLASWVIAAAALASVCPLEAHHSISMIDISKSIWIKGTVVRYEQVNPHAFIALQERTEDGRIRRWTVEGPILARLNRMGVGKNFLKAGEVIEVCGFPLKENISFRNLSENASGSPRPFVHGHMLVMSDGQMRPWGPYGKLDNCVRPDDPAQRWLNFLNKDPIARDLWCARTSLPTSASRALVDQINRGLTKPCE